MYCNMYDFKKIYKILFYSNFQLVQSLIPANGQRTHMERNTWLFYLRVYVCFKIDYTISTFKMKYLLPYHFVILNILAKVQWSQPQRADQKLKFDFFDNKPAITNNRIMTKPKKQPSKVRKAKREIVFRRQLMHNAAAQIARKLVQSKAANDGRIRIIPLMPLIAT